MKKTIRIVLICALLAYAILATVSCAGRVGPVRSGQDAQPTLSAPPPASSKHPGKFVCGVTENKPMNYMEDGEWTGFDTEFALLVGEKLGLDIEFKIIDWDRKFFELNSGSIDAIWNGFTASAIEKGVPRSNFCDMSYSYMLNTQCVVVKTGRLGEFLSADDLAGTTLIAGSGSRGEDYSKKLAGDSGNTIGAATQIDALSEVDAGNADGAVIDVVLARKIADSGDHTGLSIAFELDTEVFAIGFKKGNSLRNNVNNAILQLYNDGTLFGIAKKYGIENNLVLDTTFGRLGGDDCDC